MTSPAKFATLRFSQANPRGAEQDSVRALLRRVTDTISGLGDIQALDLVLHSELTSDDESWPSLTVYYADQEESGH